MRKTGIVLSALLLALPAASSAAVPDNSVTSVKIVDGAVAAVDLANGAVTSAKILDGTIGAADLANGAVTDAKIAGVSASKVSGTVANADTVDGQHAAAFAPASHGHPASAIEGLDGVYQKKYGKVAVVAKSGGDFSEPSAALTNLAAWCGTPSSTNPCLVKIMPGVYDLGATTLEMQEYVDVEGSGANVTILSGATPTTAVVRVPAYAELRDLTVDVLNGTAVDNSGTYPAIRNVTIRVIASGENLATGLVLNDSFADVEDVKIISSGYAPHSLRIRSSYGQTTPRFRRLEINASSSSGQGRVVTNENWQPVTFEDCKIVSSGIVSAFDGSRGLNLVRSRVETSGAWSAINSVIDLVIKDSYISHDGVYAVIDIVDNLKVSDSEIVSVSGVPLFSRVGSTYVNNSKLAGPLAEGTVTKCISCFDADFNLITVP
jgi:hypothetical protein